MRDARSVFLVLTCFFSFRLLRRILYFIQFSLARHNESGLAKGAGVLFSGVGKVRF
jgi:hypothetical protein